MKYLILLFAALISACSSPEEDYGKAKSLYQKGNYLEAEQYYDRAAKKGNVNAMYELGVMCIEGNLIPRNGEKAIKLLEKASKEGHIDAAYRLGIAYTEGEFEKDAEKGMHFIRIAALGGNTEAQSIIVAQNMMSIAENILDNNGIVYSDLRLTDFGESIYVPNLLVINVTGTFTGVFRKNSKFTATVQYMEERTIGQENGLLLNAPGYSYCNGTIVNDQTVRTCSKSMQISTY